MINRREFLMAPAAVSAAAAQARKQPNILHLQSDQRQWATIAGRSPLPYAEPESPGLRRDAVRASLHSFGSLLPVAHDDPLRRVPLASKTGSAWRAGRGARQRSGKPAPPPRGWRSRPAVAGPPPAAQRAETPAWQPAVAPCSDRRRRRRLAYLAPCERRHRHARRLAHVGIGPPAAAGEREAVHQLAAPRMAALGPRGRRAAAPPRRGREGGRKTARPVRAGGRQWLGGRDSQRAPRRHRHARRARRNRASSNRRRTRGRPSACCRAAHRTAAAARIDALGPRVAWPPPAA